MAIGFEFFTTYATQEGVAPNLEELSDKDYEWLINGDGIYFEVEWIHGKVPRVYHFYTPDETLQHIWEILGL